MKSSVTTKATTKTKESRSQRGRASHSAGSNESRRTEILRWIALAGPSLFVFSQLRPTRLLANTTPAGGDLGAHNIGPPFLRGHLLDQGLLSGWSSAWYGGFPAFRFYMPIPALSAVLLDVVLPSGIALKLAVAIPLVALPAIAILFARTAGLTYPAGPLLAAASLLFLFDDSYTKLGGNIASTIVGEYAYAWGLVAGLGCLALFNRDLERGGRGPLCAVVGAVAAGSHPVALLFVIVGLSSRVAVSWSTQRRASLIHYARTLVLIFLLSAFWYVPLVWYRNYYNDLNNQRSNDFGSLLFSLPAALEMLVVALAIFGSAVAVRDRRAAVVALAATALVFLLGVLVAPSGALWNARLAPPWLLCKVLLAGVGAADLVAMASARRPRETIRIRYGAPLAVVAIVAIALAWDLGSLPGGTETAQQLPGGSKLVSQTKWIVGPSHRPNNIAQFTMFGFGGYERGPSWPQYDEFINGMTTQAGVHGCGRVQYEFDSTGEFGSTYAIALLPYWTDGCLTTVMGFYTESSANSAMALVAESAASPVFSNYEAGLPYERVDLRRTVAYMRDFGAKYYVAKTPTVRTQARSTPGLHSLGVAGGWEIFLLDDVALVEGLAALPTVVGAQGRDEWEQTALGWFTRADSDAPRLATSGPSAWPRGESGSTSTPSGGSRVVVSDIVDGGDKITFHVDQIGLPVLVRATYFPTWKASGAEGPWRVTPNWMVVVPTSADVTLQTRAGVVEWFAAILTLAGLLVVVALSLVGRLTAPGPDTPEGEHR